MFSQSNFNLSQAQLFTYYGIIATSSFLSFCGSCLICLHVIIGKNFCKIYHRLLFCLSVADMVTSFRLIISSIFYDVATPEAPVCEPAAFLTLLGYAGPYYTGCLGFYFLLVIKYNVSATRIAERYEPIFHLVAIGYALFSATLGWILGVYNPGYYPLGCYISEYPAFCDEDNTVECTRGANAKVFLWAAAVTPLILVLVTLALNNTFIFLLVRNQLRRYEFIDNRDMRSAH